MNTRRTLRSTSRLSNESNKPEQSQLKSDTTKKSETKLIPNEDDGSSSDSSVGDYLTNANDIDLNSTFFKFESTQEKQPDFEALEKNILEGVRKLSDSESEDEEVFDNNVPATQNEPKKKLNFTQLNNYNKKIEETKKCVENYKSKQNKNVPDKNDDIQRLLSLGETNEQKDEDMLESDFESDDEMEWEEIKENDKQSEPVGIPKEGLQITVALPNSIRKKKQMDFISVVKRRINRIKKENQVYIHKVHLLCWIAYGNYLNSVLNNENLMALALSLLPSEKSFPSKRIDLEYLGQILKWYRGMMNIQKKEEKDISLIETLEMEINNKEAWCERDFIFIFIIILRSLGLDCRLVLSFRVLPLRPPNSELCSLSTKDNSNDKKAKVKSKKINNKLNVSASKVKNTKTNERIKQNYEKKSINTTEQINAKREIQHMRDNKENSAKDLSKNKKTDKKETQNSKENSDLKKTTSEMKRNVTKKELEYKKEKSGVKENRKTENEIKHKDAKKEKGNSKGKLDLHENKKSVSRGRENNEKRESGNSNSNIVKVKENSTKCERENNKEKSKRNEIKENVVKKEKRNSQEKSENTKMKLRDIKKENKYKTENTKNQTEIKEDATKKERKNSEEKSNINENKKMNEIEQIDIKKETKISKEKSSKEKSTNKNTDDKREGKEISSKSSIVKDKKDFRNVKTSKERSSKRRSSNKDSESNHDKSPSKDSKLKISQLDGIDDAEASTSKVHKTTKPNLKSLKDNTKEKSNTDFCTSKYHTRPKTKRDSISSNSDSDFRTTTPKVSSNKKPKYDVKSDIMNLIKGEIVKQKHIDRRNIVKKKPGSDSDSDFAPEPVKKRRSNEMKPETLKVKRRIPPKSELLKQEIKKEKEKKGEESKKETGVDFWLEVFVEEEEKWISVDVVSGSLHCVSDLQKQATQPVSYIVAWKNNLSLKDVTARYCPNWNTVTRKLRVDPVWWNETLKPYFGIKTVKDREEDEDLATQQLEQPLPKTINEYKNHPLYVLKRHLLKFEAIYPPDAVTLGFVRNEAVYARECVYTLHSREIWVKHAKVVKPAQQPYKIVKARPKYDKLSGTMITDKPLEIFGKWQVDDYVPPTAENGVVPRNAFGNVELFKPCMLPKKTVHLQLPGLNKVARKLNIDCAPAVVGFDFHCGGSHPMFDGFVVCEEFEDTLIAAWEQEQEETAKREQDKYEKRVYGNWRKLIKGLLIRERLKARYDFGDTSIQKSKTKKSVKK